TVTAALACLAVWLFLTIFAPAITQIVAGMIMSDPSTPEAALRQYDIQNMLDRIVSPATLYGETVQVLLNPMARGVAAALPEQNQGILLTPLQLRDSLLLFLPQFTALLALVGVCFAVCYIKFMRTEIRA